jgi:hypothetical protein
MGVITHIPSFLIRAENTESLETNLLLIQNGTSFRAQPLEALSRLLK